MAWLVVHVALIAGAVLVRRRLPLLSAAACFLYFPLVPVANWPFQLGIATAERFLYLPVLAAALLAAWLLGRAGRHGLVPAAALVIACAGISFVRIPDWRSADTIMAAAHAHGGSPRSHIWRSARLRQRRSRHSVPEMSGAPQRCARRRWLGGPRGAARHPLSPSRAPPENRSHIVVEPHVNAADLLSLARLRRARRCGTPTAPRTRAATYTRRSSSIAPAPLLRLERGAAAYRAMAAGTRGRASMTRTRTSPVMFLKAASELAERDGLLDRSRSGGLHALRWTSAQRNARCGSARQSCSSVSPARRDAAIRDVPPGCDLDSTRWFRRVLPDEWRRGSRTTSPHDPGPEGRLLARDLCRGVGRRRVSRVICFELWTAAPRDGEPPPEATRVVLSLSRIGTRAPPCRRIADGGPGRPCNLLGQAVTGGRMRQSGDGRGARYLRRHRPAPRSPSATGTFLTGTNVLILVMLLVLVGARVRAAAAGPHGS